MKVLRTIKVSEAKPTDLFILSPTSKHFFRAGSAGIEPTMKMAIKEKTTYQRDKRNGYSGLFRMGLPYPDFYDQHLHPDLEANIVQYNKEDLGIIPISRTNSATGSDPEVFVQDGEGQIIPAYKYLPNKKTATAKGFAAYADGFAAEYCIQAVACHGFVMDYIRYGLVQVSNHAKKFDPKAKITIKNTFVVPNEMMQAATPEDIELGCEPSFNAYGEESAIRQGDPKDHKVRSAGGHIHLGLREEWKKSVPNLIQGMDIGIGVASVAMFASIDDPMRRMFYGRAGEYRTPKHGLEYRTLSNAWLCDPRINHLVFNLARVGAAFGATGFHKKLGIKEQLIRDIINFCDVKKARAWMHRRKQLFQVLFKNEGILYGDPELKNFYALIDGGVEAIVKDPTDVEGNWNIGKHWDTHSNGDKATWATVKIAK